MNEENQESSQEGESGELPTPSFSDQGGSSTSDADVIVSKVIAQLDPLIEKKLQSTKDKRFSQLNKVLGGRDTLLAELAEQGVAIPDNVRTAMQIQDLRDQLTQAPTQQPAPGRDSGLSQQKQAVKDAISELSKYELDPNDADFIGLLRGNYKNRAEFDLAVSKHVVSKLAPPKPASAGGLVQGASRSSSKDDGGQRFADEYDREKAKIPRGQIAELRNLQKRIKQQAKEAGYNITF